jgi:hypothetical protein
MVKEKLEDLKPDIDKLADVMEPMHQKEALAPMKEPVPETIFIDPINKLFGDVMKTICNIGLAVIIISAGLYFLGVFPGDNPDLEVLKWSEPAKNFWKDTRGIEINGYSWFLSNPADPENIVILGIAFLALTPLVGFLMTIPKSHGALRILLVIITIEFIYAIIRPLISTVGGAH